MARASFQEPLTFVIPLHLIQIELLIVFVLLGRWSPHQSLLLLLDLSLVNFLMVFIICRLDPFSFKDVAIYFRHLNLSYYEMVISYNFVIIIEMII